MTESEEITFGGDRMLFTEDEHGTAHIKFDDVGTGRNCGDCQLCCRLIPVPPLHKLAGVRCQHQKYKVGCSIYDSRPFPCRAWSCRWLADPRTAGMPRPDRCHYIIDLQYDEVRLAYEDGKAADVQVVQVWVDPAYPDAHQAPELRRYMATMAAQYRVGTIVRFNATKAVTIFPPAISADNQWHEIRHGIVINRESRESLHRRELSA